MAFTRTFLRICRFLESFASLPEVKKRLGRLLDRKGSWSTCPVIWLVVLCRSLPGESGSVVALNFSTVGKHVVLELLFRVASEWAVFPSFCTKLSSVSLSSTAVVADVLPFRLTCQRQWSPTATSTTTTSAAAVRKMVMDDARRATL